MDLRSLGMVGSQSVPRLASIVIHIPLTLTNAPLRAQSGVVRMYHHLFADSAARQEQA